MKKIGLVGGTGPESTLMYYKELNSRIDEMTGQKEMPEIIIDSVDFRKAWGYVVDSDYDALSDYLAEKVKNLKAGGADVISLTAATMHVVYNEISAKSGVSMISIPKAVSEEAVKRGYKKVGLLGTIFTMEKDYMKNDLIDAGVEVIIPDKTDRELVAKRIYEELEFGIVKESTLAEFVSIIRKLKEQKGIEAVILGCTELPILLNSDNTPVPCLDSVDIHIRKLIEEAQEQADK